MISSGGIVTVVVALAFNLITASLQLVQVETDENYSETSAWYRISRGKIKEGLIPKAIRLLDKIRIISLNFNFIAAEVPSESSNSVYSVKINLSPFLDFSCTCPWGEYRARPCKHVLAVAFYPLRFLYDIKEERIVTRETTISYSDYEVYQILTIVHRALNKAAFLRVRRGESYI